MGSCSEQIASSVAVDGMLADEGFCSLPDRLFDLLPVGIYVCDRAGHIVRYNSTAASLWGRSPAIGAPESRYCGSYRLLDLDGTRIPHAECPMAHVLASGHGLRDQSIQIERPDGTRIRALVNIEPLFDAAGRVTGAVNVFQESTAARHQQLHFDEDAMISADLLNSLPVALYTTDAAGRITFFNDAAVALWGVRPDIGTKRFCGSWRLYAPDGSPLPHEECPTAIALRERRAMRGVEAVAERPDGSRVSFLAYPTPLYDPAGRLTGAVNMLVDISGRRGMGEAEQRLAAIVESSDDAILAKDVNGIITSWNAGATRLFGYQASEAVGRSVTMLIPEDRLDEEPEILGRILRGERIDHYETIRRRKDGSLVDISLTVSPVRGPDGTIVGASKIARDISERRRAEEQRALLLREMAHRMKNLFAVCSSLVSVSARSAESVDDLATEVQQRLDALSRAHALTVDGPARGAEAGRGTTLHALIRSILSPYDDDGARLSIGGCDLAVSENSVTSLALLLHEFATNAAKYGAFATPDGRIDIDCTEQGEQLVLAWRETGGPAIEPVVGREEGFGSLLARRTVEAQLGGSLTHDWAPEGLTIRLSLDRGRLAL